MIWSYQERKKKREPKVWRIGIKGQNIKKKGEQKEVKQILNETLFKYPCSKQPSHHFLGPLLSFSFIPLDLATIQA